MSLSGWNVNNKLKLAIDHTKIDEDLSDFPVLITLSSGSGQTGYDASAVFTELTSTTSGTVFLYHCDGDQSDSLHTITVHGNPTTSSGVFNGGMYFDGTGDYLSLPTSFDWDFGTGDFTIDWWFNADTVVDDDGMFSLRQSTSTLLNARTGGGNPLTIRINGGTISSSDVVAGQWYHIALVRHGNVFTVYLNGTVVDTADVTGVSFDDNSGGIWIGQYYSSSYPFQGYIDEFRISKGVARWTTSFSGSLPTAPYLPDSDTVLLFHMDGDQSDAEHVITFNGDPQFNTTTSKFDGSIYFDGTGDYLSLPTSSDWDFGTGDFTIDFWINPDTITSDDGVFSLGQVAASGTDLAMYIYTNNFRVYRGGVGDIITTTDISISTWQHIALVRDSDELTLYVDGTSKGTYDVTGLSFDDSSSGLWIGMYNISLTFAGYLDEFRIVKGQALWTSNFTPNKGPYGSSRENSKKIAVTTTVSGVETQLPVEIDWWDWSFKKAWLWTKVPTISSGIDTILYLYYDKSHADNTSYVGDIGETAAQNVWDSNFKAVYHFSQNPVTGSGSILDSVSGGRNGNPSGSMNSFDLVDSLAGVGLDFDGVDDVIKVPYNSAVDITDVLTLEAVVKPASNIVYGSGKTRGVLSRQHDPTTDQNTWAWFFNVDGQLQLGSYGGNIKSSKNSWDAGTVYVIAGTYNSTGFTGDLFVDGVKQSLAASSYEGMTTVNNYLDIGVLNPASGNFFDGVIDEVRVSRAVRSDAWLKATNFTLRDSFITFIPKSYYFAGYVSELSSSISGAQIYMYKQSDGSLVGSTTSSGDGGFYLTTSYSGAHFLVCIDPNNGETYNNLIYGDMYPATTSD